MHGKPAQKHTLLVREECVSAIVYYIHGIVKRRYNVKFSIIVSPVSTHGHLNIARDFGLHRRLPGIKIPYVFMEAATVLVAP